MAKKIASNLANFPTEELLAELGSRFDHWMFLGQSDTDGGADMLARWVGYDKAPDLRKAVDLVSDMVYFPDDDIGAPGCKKQKVGF